MWLHQTLMPTLASFDFLSLLQSFFPFCIFICVSTSTLLNCISGTSTRRSLEATQWVVRGQECGCLPGREPNRAAFLSLFGVSVPIGVFFKRSFKRFYTLPITSPTNPPRKPSERWFCGLGHPGGSDPSLSWRSATFTLTRLLCGRYNVGGIWLQAPVDMKLLGEINQKFSSTCNQFFVLLLGGLILFLEGQVFL